MKTKMLQCLVFSSLIATCCEAQIIRNIKNGVKRDIEYKVEKKVNEKINQGIDSVGKKSGKKQKSSEGESTSQSSAKGDEMVSASTSNNTAVIQSGQEIKNPGEGFITLKLSTPITTKGLSVTFSGESIRYEKWKTVKILIKSPKDEEEIETALSDSGRYHLYWDKLTEEGDYLITATSSDGKSKVTERLKVNDWYQPQDETTDLMNETGKAFERLRNRASRLKGIISQSENADLDRKMADMKEAVDGINEMADNLQKGKQEVANVIKAGHPMPDNIAHHLSQLNKLVTGKTEDIRKLSAARDHEPYENTICEYITMMQETAAAFYTFTAGWLDLVSSTCFKIALNRGIEWANPNVNSPEQEAGEIYVKQVSKSDLKWSGKEATKVFSIYGITTKKVQALSDKWKQTQFASNLVRFAGDVLLRKYCGVFRGDVSHTYEINYQHNGLAWWKYGFRLEAALVLRYPKTTEGGVIKMKGNIEGHATKFSFMADPRNNPEFRQGTGGKVEVMILKSMTPLAIPVSSSIATKDWGWIARATATPAYFNIPVDAEYNTETEKITLFLKEATLDFSEFVYNRQVFILWSAGLPLLKMMDYPISKARTTLNASLKNNNELMVKKNVKGELFFTHDVKREINTASDPTHHQLHITIKGKKE